MRIRLSTARATAAAASAVAIAALATVGGASAAPTAHRAPDGTACRAVLPGCGTLLVDSPSGALALQARAALAGAPILVQQQDPAQSLQDWTLQLLGTVNRIPVPERQLLGITGYDLRAYGADDAARLEFTPDGQRTGLCADGSALKLVLAPCLTVRQRHPSTDVFIAVPTAAGHLAPAAHALLVLEQAHVPGDHLALRGSYRTGAQVTLARRAPVGVEIWYQDTALRPAPAVTGVSPPIFADAGGTEITITGSGFEGATQVIFGDVPAAQFTVNSDNSITAIAPAALPGSVPLFSDLRVIRWGRASMKNLADNFLQEDAQIDEVCFNGIISATLILYAAPDPQGNPTAATVNDISLSPNAIPTSTVTDEDATDGSVGWRQSTIPLVVPFGDTDTYNITADSGNKHFNNVQIPIGGIHCGISVWRG